MTTSEAIPAARSRRRRGWIVLTIVVLATLTGLVRTQVRSGTGLIEVLYDGTGANRVRRDERRTAAIDLSALAADAVRARTVPLSVGWSGAWFIAHDGLYDLFLEADDRVVWRIDGITAHARSVRDSVADRRTVRLTAGFHTIDVDYEQDIGDYRADLAWAPAGEPRRSLPAEDFFVTMPAHPRVFAVMRRIDRVLTWTWIAGFALVAVWGAAWLGRRLPAILRIRIARHPRMSSVLLIAPLALIVIYGAALRLEGLTVRYGLVEHPRWVRALQAASVSAVPAIRPAGMAWEPSQTFPHADGTSSLYISDPYTYLLRAREMRSFYGAHYREPVFPFATKIFLGWLGNQDVAVSFASATFSVLAVIATYWLGVLVFGSRLVGIGGALAFAVEHDVISWAISGWRDDAYVLAVVLAVCMALVYRRHPSLWRALALGVAAAFACLTRIFALSFLLPMFLVLLVWGPGEWRRRVQHLAIATGVALVLASPYFINCWREYGDPLYTLNYQPLAYLAWEGKQSAAAPPGAVGYIREKLSSTPWQTIDTTAAGLTSYPFANKWNGFNVWSPRWRPWLSSMALAGLVLCVANPPGRIVLLVLLSGMVPFAFTWKLSSDWRYTAFTYPFYLVAAGAAALYVVRFIGRPTRQWVVPAHWRRQAAAWAGVGLSLAAYAWVTQRTLPRLVARELLSRNAPAILMAGERDDMFFVSGWSAPFIHGNVSWRVSDGPVQTVRVSLPRSANYQVLLRVDPFPRPISTPAVLPRLRVNLNGRPVAEFDLEWDPDRVGRYPFTIPAALTTAGKNELTISAESKNVAGGAGLQPGLSEGVAYGLWNVVIRPM